MGFSLKHTFNKLTGHDARKKQREAARREQALMRQMQIENENRLMLQGSVGAGDVDATAVAGSGASDYDMAMPGRKKKRLGTSSESLGII